MTLCPVTNGERALTQATLTVPGAHCGCCRADIEWILTRLPAVSSAIVDLRDKTVTITFHETYDEAPASAAATDALRAAGYLVPR